MLRPKTPADLERARDDIAWIDGDDLREVESKSRVGAALLGLFTWGGGRIYAGDVARGIGAIVLLAAWASVSALLPEAVGTFGFLLGGGAAAAWSDRGVRSINAFVRTRDELALRAGPGAAAYQLLAGAIAADPSLASQLPVLPLHPGLVAPAPAGPYSEATDQLRKLHAVRRAGVIDDTDHRDRKVDILTGLAPGSRTELDALLYALLPLLDEGVLVQEDFEFLKQMGGMR